VGDEGTAGLVSKIKDRLLFEERGKRKIMLHLVLLLFNFRASTVGMNQIQSSFMPHLVRSANKFAR
jgi:hypothetical protein